MPPFRLNPRFFDPGVPATAFSDQWKNPGDVFSVLLLLGGDVISRALAQLAGTNGQITTVTFSFGWVAYSVTALLCAIGEKRLMPSPDTSCLVINGSSGYSRQNNSWTISRLVRDYEHWMPLQARQHLERVLDRKWSEEREAVAAKRKRSSPSSTSPSPHAATELRALDPSQIQRPTQASLLVSVFAARDRHPAAPRPDLVYLSGFATGIVQIGVAAVPCGLYGDWGVLLVTAVGTLLALATGSLPQWGREKWACRRDCAKRVVLTRGNGAQHAIVVLGEGKGLDLEDLAAGPENVVLSLSAWTVAAAVVLGALWIVLLITAAGLKEHTWFLVAVGGIGMLQNIFVAGARRRPEAVGLPLEFKEVFGETKVFRTLLEVEKRYPRVGKSMLDTFFPGGRFTESELAMWAEVEARRDESDEKEST